MAKDVQFYKMEPSDVDSGTARSRAGDTSQDMTLRGTGPVVFADKENTGSIGATSETGNSNELDGGPSMSRGKVIDFGKHMDEVDGIA
jgi:hypothetical protein